MKPYHVLVSALIVAVLVASVASGQNYPIAASTQDASTGPEDCFGIPWLSSGQFGCGPLQIGADNMTGIEVRMAGGETFALWQGGEQQLYMEAQPQNDWSMATFSRDVRARGFLTPNAPLLMADTTLDHTMSTVRVGAVVTLTLPQATYNPGRAFTIKPVNGGMATVVAPPGEDIDGLTQWTVYPPDCLRLEGWNTPGPAVGGSGWMVVGRCR
jgi:hypothetical protein